MNKILEALRKWAWLLLIAAVVFGLADIWMTIRARAVAAAYRVEKAAFVKDKAASEAEIARLVEEKAGWMKEANVAYAAADKAQAEKWALEDAMAAKDAENAALRAKIATMPAGEVVTETLRILSIADTTAIQETALGVRFTLSAARTNLARLTEADYFSLVKEPDYKCLLQKNQEEIDALRLTVANQGNAIVSLEGVVLEHERLKTAYSAILAKAEKQSKWLKFTIGGGAVAITAAGLYLLLK